MIYIRKVGTALLVVAASTIVACDGGPTGPTTGSLTVNIPDLPAGVPAAVTVTGPEGIPRIDVAGTRTIPDLTPGTYLVSAAKAVGSRATYTTSAAAQTVEVVASSTPASVTVPYTLATGIVNLAIGGLPSGTNAAVTLFDGKGFFVNLTASGEIVNLEPGEYMIQAQLVTADEVYAGTPSPATISVSASPTPAQAQVTYSATTGSMQVSSSRLPTGAVPAWDITGPGSYAGTISGVGTQVLSRLTPGRYTATARNFDFGAETYGAETRSVAIDVTPGVKVPAAFIYVTRPPTLNVSIDGAYLNQSTQRYNGSVPLVANRAAYVRVFVKANENNSATPKVRVRFYRGGEVISTSTITAPMSTVGLTVSERTTNDSWGVVVPGTVIQPGTSMLVDVDPDNTVREVSEADNAFPASGSPVPLDVRVVPRAEVTFVPIATTANGLVGNVSDARKESLLAPTIGMFPIADY